MPHLSLEYSAAAADKYDFDALCNALFDALADHPEVANPRNLKIRAYPCPYVRIGTKPESFVHASLGLLTGRSDVIKSDLTKTVLNVLEQHLGEIGALSVDCYDLSSAYVKRAL